MKHIILLAFIALIAAGCYRMPDDDYLSVIPMTNNPRVVPQKANALAPSMSY